MATDISDPTELLRWWHQYQAHMLIQETDFVRNGILQEIIAIRRRLEMSCPLQPPANDTVCAPHLADLTRLYNLLENFCDRLQSPFIADSLPLALQHAMRPWQAALNLQSHLPAQWSTEPLEQAQLLIWLMKALLSLLVELPRSPIATTLTMSEADALKTLAFQAQYGAPLVPAVSQQVESALQPFLNTFRLLTQARCAVVFQADGFSLKLGWQTLPAAPPNHLASAPPPNHLSDS